MFDTPQERIKSLKDGWPMEEIEYYYNASHRRAVLGIEPVHELEMKPQEIRRIK